MTNLQNKKITMSTVKSFVKNAGKLFVEQQSSFNSMVDYVVPCKDSELKEISKENALGHKGAWVVGQSCDYFNYKEMTAETIKYVGIEISNCCGSAILWTAL